MDINIFANNHTVKLRDRILLSSVTKYVVSSLITGVLLLTSVYVIMLLVLNNIDDDWPVTCDIAPSYQVECLSGQKTNYDTCSMIGCCWSDKINKCYHSIPSKHGYYYYNDSVINNEEDITLHRRRELSPTGEHNWPILYFHVTPIDSEYLQLNLRSRRREKISRNTTNTYINDVDPGLSVLINSPAFSVTLLRHRLNSVKINLLTTSLGPLIVTENYWEWTIHMANVTLYGLQSTYLNGTTHWLYNNARGSEIPAFFGITLEGEAVACYVLYSGPMEIRILNGSNLIILKGISLPDEISFRVFASSTPQKTLMRLFKSLKDDGMIMKMNSAVPLPIVTASLGPHVCPELEHIDGSILESIKATIDSTNKTQVLWDSHCIHRQFYSTLDTVLNNNESEILIESRKMIEAAGKHLVPHLTPMILGENSILVSKLENSSLVLKKSLLAYLGSCRGTSVVYPDWSNNRTYNIFENYISNYSNTFGISKLIFIRDDWPRDDSNSISSDFSQFDYMPQELQRLMSLGTIPFELTAMTVTSHYTTHNAYANKFHDFIQQNAYPLPSRNVFFQNIDDNVADMNGWSSLRTAVNRGIASGLTGQLPPIIYVCSTSPDITDELCIRWYGAAVVFPYVMAIPQYLPGGAWITTGSSNYATKLLKLRASLITYQRTVVEEYYNVGLPVLAPTHFYYSMESFINNAKTMDEFFWGESLLVGLVTLPNTKQVNMQIPGNYSWRHFEGGAEVPPTSGTKRISIPALEGEIVILVRPGHIIPVHENVGLTSVETVQNNIELLVNFQCNKDTMNCLAQGKIGYGSGIFLNIVVNETVVTLKNILNARSRACITSVHHSTLIKYLTILGDISRYRLLLDINLCAINDDEFIKKT